VGLSPVRFALAVAQNRRGGVPRRPSFCTYLVSYRCNARCGMCDSWRMKPGREMTAREAGEVFTRIGALDAVRLTGGEPFLREDLGDIAEEVMRASSPALVHVTTNGSFPDRAARLHERFSRPRRLFFLVSLDGLEEEHDRSRGEDASFARAMATVETLVARGARVAVNHTVVSPRSLDDHRALRARLEPLGVDVSCVLAYAGSAMYGLKLRGKKAEHLVVPRGYPLHPALAGADVVGFLEEELRALPRTRDIALRAAKRYYVAGLLARLRGDEDPRPRPPRCVALRSHVRLLPDGRVPVCQFNTETVGDLREDGFDTVWHGDAARAARAWVDACPGCWAECEAMPSAVYTGDLFVEMARRVLA
jgi:MoaA/NifB/PqqE/SkfB family radical SAM enzyme